MLDNFAMAEVPHRILKAPTGVLNPTSKQLRSAASR
jgi:hypothetical protein